MSKELKIQNISQTGERKKISCNTPAPIKPFYTQAPRGWTPVFIAPPFYSSILASSSSINSEVLFLERLGLYSDPNLSQLCKNNQTTLLDLGNIGNYYWARYYIFETYLKYQYRI
uniref:Uncharacterized protein n=1 Tax=Arundo donax TaxID=35708 RepID=A0A0A8ZEZ2_ARUDO